MQSNAQSDLDLQALQYVTENLNAAQRAAFEERLAVDQSARESVALIAQMSAALSSLPVEPLTTARGGWLKPLVWASLGAAASVLLMLSWQAFSFPSDEVAAIGDRPKAVARQTAPATLSLAQSWARVRSRVGTDESEPSGAAIVADAEPTLPADLELLADVSVPTWLVQAVTGEAPEFDDDWY